MYCKGYLLLHQSKLKGILTILKVHILKYASSWIVDTKCILLVDSL